MLGILQRLRVRRNHQWCYTPTLHSPTKWSDIAVTMVMNFQTVGGSNLSPVNHKDGLYWGIIVQVCTTHFLFSTIGKFLSVLWRFFPFTDFIHRLHFPRLNKLEVITPIRNQQSTIHCYQPTRKFYLHHSLPIEIQNKIERASLCW